MTPAQTSILVAVLFVVIVAFDVYLDRDNIPGNTYSERIRAWGRRWVWFPYALAFGFGVLLGHWFL